MSESARAMLQRIAAIALLSALVGCGHDAVESKLVGSWQTAVASPNGPYQLRLTTAANGAYRIDSQGQAVGEAETGAFTASAGKWRREKLTGGSNEGTYEFLSPDTVLFKSKTETLLWSRVPNDAAAAASPQAPAAANAAQGTLAANGSAMGVAQPSAALLAAGPFGAPLPPAATTELPQVPAGGSSFGATAPSTPQSQAGGGTRPPQAQPATPSPGAADQPSYVQHARQAKAQAKSAASEAQAAANDAGTAVKAQADDVAKSLGPFRKAGSKIKNFFTGHKSQDDSDSTGQAAPDNH